MDGGLKEDLALTELATESPLTGVVVGVELAYRSLHNLRKRGAMQNAERREELEGLLAAELGDQAAGATAEFHDNDIHDNHFHFGLDAETVERLIKLAQGKEAAA